MYLVVFGVNVRDMDGIGREIGIGIGRGGGGGKKIEVEVER